MRPQHPPRPLEHLGRREALRAELVANQPGQRLRKEAAVHVSNLALWNEAEQRRVKVGYAFSDDGATKFRIDKKTGARLDA